MSITKHNYIPTYYIKLTFVALLITYILTGIAYSNSENDLFMLLVGIMIQLIFTIAITLRKNIFLFEPIVLMYLAITVGVTIKIPYLIANTEIMEKLLIGQDQSIFVYGAIYIFLGFSFFIIGHLTHLKKAISKNTVSAEYYWLEGRLKLSLLVLLITTFIASILVISNIGIDNLLTSFSAKRFQDLDDRTSRLSSELYIYYKISLLSRIPLYLSFIYLISPIKQKKSTKSLLKIIFLLSFIVSIAIPTVFNNRATVALSIFDMIAIGVFMGKKFKRKYIVLAILLIIIPFIYSTAERSVSSESSINIFSSILDNRYFLDLTKTSHIIEYFRNNDITLYGETLIGWFFILIPSSIMENQPRFMEIGLYLGDAVFKFNKESLTGVPPGFVAELFMNFGLLGIIIGMLITGILMQKLYNYYLTNRDNIFVTVFIAMISLRFIIFLFNNDLGTFIIKNLLETLPTLIMLSALLKVKKHISS